MQNCFISMCIDCMEFRSIHTHAQLSLFKKIISHQTFHQCKADSIKMLLFITYFVVICVISHGQYDRKLMSRISLPLHAENVSELGTS